MGDRQRAVEWYNAGVSAANDKSQPAYLQQAYHLFSSAVFVDSSFGEAWYGLGNANMDLKMHAASLAAWRRALQCELPDEMRARCLNNCGWTTYQLGHVEDALEFLNEAINVQPKLDAAWRGRGVVYGTLGDQPRAVADSRRAVELNPDDATNQFGLGIHLLYAGQYEEGFKWFEARFEYALHKFLKFPYPKWDGTPDKTLFLVADQGLGDTLSYARFVEQTAKRCKYVHAVVQAELLQVFTEAWAHLPNINLIPLASPFQPADAWSTFVSLPHALGLTDKEIKSAPQIKLPLYSKSTSWMVPDVKFHIGIAWAGSPLNEINNWRSIPVDRFMDLYKVPGIQLYGLQVGERNADLQATGSVALVRDLSQYISNVTDTVALLRDLDLVICCESALAHICAAVGKECWIPYSYMGRDYRIGSDGENMLWTPKHRIFKQGPDQQWGPVFEQIVTALREKVGNVARGQVAA